jgi:hypothetical protein
MREIWFTMAAMRAVRLIDTSFNKDAVDRRETLREGAVRISPRVPEGGRTSVSRMAGPKSKKPNHDGWASA